ncbi:MAG: response regulator transcription factor [Syntrophobacteraceae bacterium]
MGHLLLIDDDIEFCELLADYLALEGFETTSVHDGNRGLKQALAGKELYDLIILDIELPGMSGFELIQRLRIEMETPVLMLTGRNQEVDRIVGLEIGADDFVVKPCNPRELAARIRAILRRTCRRPESRNETERSRFVVGDVALDTGARVAQRSGEQLDLTSAEFDLLQILLGAAGSVVTREELSTQVLGRSLSPFDRSLDMHLSRLRKKLGHEFNGIERIKTVRNVGYLYALPSSIESRASAS